MFIALDYDNTYTRDPEFWLDFVQKAHSCNHCVMCVTMRYPHEVLNMDKRLLELVEVIPTGRKAKKKFMRLQGHQVDIWIDDNPDGLYEDFT